MGLHILIAYPLLFLFVSVLFKQCQLAVGDLAFRLRVFFFAFLGLSPIEAGNFWPGLDWSQFLLFSFWALRPPKPGTSVPGLTVVFFLFSSNFFYCFISSIFSIYFTGFPVLARFFIFSFFLFPFSLFNNNFFFGHCL